MIRAVRNTAVLGFAFPVLVLLSFAQVKILTSVFAPALFGLYAAAAAVGALLSVGCELGLAVALPRLIAALEARGDARAARRVTQVCLAASLAMAAVLIAVAAFGGAAIGRLFGDQPLPATLVLWGTIFGVTGALRTVTGAAFYGLRDMVPPAVSDIAWLGAATLAIFLLRARLTPALTLQVEVGAQVLAVLGLHVVLWRRGFARAGGPGVVPWGEVRRYAGGAMVMSLLGVVMENVDKPLVGSAPGNGYASVANFHFAAKIVYYGRRLLYLPLAAVGPEFTRVWERGDPEIAVRDLTLVTKLQMIVALALWALATALARPVVETLSTAAYGDAARVLVVLALVLPLSALYTPATTALRAVGHIWPTVVGDVLWTVVFMGSGWLLLRRSGIAGLAEAQVLASVVTGLYTLLIARRMLGLRVRWILQVRAPAAALLTAGTVGVATHLIHLPPAVWVVGGGAAGLLLYGALVRLFGVLAPAEKARLLDLLPGGVVRRVVERAL